MPPNTDNIQFRMLFVTRYSFPRRCGPGVSHVAVDGVVDDVVEAGAQMFVVDVEDSSATSERCE